MVPRFGVITLTQDAGDEGPTRHMDQCIFIHFRRARNHGHETMSKSWKIYDRQLASLGHGIPLWRPDIRLPGNTADTITLGDVGILYEGAFHRIFNITVESSDRLNQLGVPVDFEPYFSTDHDAGVSRALDLILRQDHPYEQIVRVPSSNASCSTGLADVILEKMQEVSSIC